MKDKLFFFIKRLIDIVGSTFLVILFSPILIIVAILVYRTSKSGISQKYPQVGHKNNLLNNIFFIQDRVGANKIFRMYKFHSMYVANNDEFLKHEYPALWKKYKDADWKLTADEDPRITPVGKIIRSLTIDEFPQLFNVLRGEMSLVGPRAYRDVELKEYARKYPNCKDKIKIIRATKPGITGLWQISGRNSLTFEKRAQLDAAYAINHSLLQEISIILKTPKAMLSRW